MTGHDNGVITLNIDEADEAERVKHKTDLGERYRTLLGHFRHEIGHYYWEVLIKNSESIKKYRSLFGDEEMIIQKRSNPIIKKEHQRTGAKVSSARMPLPFLGRLGRNLGAYLHLMDTLETASSFGIRIQPDTVQDTTGIRASIQQDPYDMTDSVRLSNGGFH